jgi:heat shock protein HslJ
MKPEAGAIGGKGLHLMRFLCKTIPVGLAFVLAACKSGSDGKVPPNPLAQGLAGTTWQLVEIQSMDDAQGTRRPGDGSRYVIDFGGDGHVSVQLDCNRGTGNWKNVVIHAGEGSLEFGPLAVTNALCVEPTLGEFLGRQLVYVRSYVIREGRLYMALMADGGILVWGPTTPSR